MATATIAAGASKLITLTGLAAGDYIYYDPSNDVQTNQAQRAIDMYGALVVRPAGRATYGPMDPRTKRTTSG